ncbi:hypothetical protein BHM03_00046855 [Ensete ventricosum]|nr:hypothetical protein BHM03_00046855 [Ensete ventricosum]
MWWDLAGSSLGDSPKEPGSSLGMRREIAGRRPEDLPQDYRRLSEYAGVDLNQLTKELVNIKIKPDFEKWREPLL